MCYFCVEVQQLRDWDILTYSSMSFCSNVQDSLGCDSDARVFEISFVEADQQTRQLTTLVISLLHGIIIIIIIIIISSSSSSSSCVIVAVSEAKRLMAGWRWYGVSSVVVVTVRGARL